MKEKEIAREAFYKLRKDTVNSLFNSEYRYTLAIYILFIDRAKYTKYIDEKSESYFIYTIDELMKNLKVKKARATITKSIEELEKLGYIKTFKNRGSSTKYYLP